MRTLGLAFVVASFVSAPLHAAEKTVTIWLVDGKKLNKKLKKAVPDAIDAALGMQTDWKLVAASKKANRQLGKLEKTCKPKGSPACAKQAAELVEVQWVVVAVVSGTRKAPTVTLVLVEAETEAASESAELDLAAEDWQTGIPGTVGQLVAAAAPAPEPAPESDADDEAVATATEALPEEAPSSDGGGADEGASVPATSASVAATATTDGAGAAEVIDAASVEAAAPATPEAGAEAEAEPEASGIGLAFAAKLGGTLPTTDLGITYFGAVDLAYEPPFIRELIGIGLGLGIEFAYVQPGNDGTIDDAAAGSVDYELDQRILMLGVDALVSIPIGMLTPYGGVGYGVYFMRAKMSSLGQENTESQIRAAMQARGGVGFRLGPGDLFGELRYHYVQLKFLSTGRSNAGGITFGVGYRLRL